jgi:hypothetical protein
MPAPTSPNAVESRVVTVRGEHVLLDADLASIYGVSTKALNQAVKRNAGRFPADFRFRLTKTERDKVVTECDHLRPLRFSAVLPWAFTEHGAVMAGAPGPTWNADRASQTQLSEKEAAMKVTDVDFGDLEEIWTERARRVAEVRWRADPRGMTRPARAPAERAWLDRQGRSGPFTEVRRRRRAHHRREGKT